MLGATVLVAMGLAYVAINFWLDRGVRERRRLGPRYASLMLAMGDFEGRGGRVHELDHVSRKARRWIVGLFAGLLAFTSVVLAAQRILGFPYWCACALIGAFVVVQGAFSWVEASVLHYVDSEGRRARWEAAPAASALIAKGAIVFAALTVAGQAAAAINDGAWVVGLSLCVVAIFLVAYCHLPVAFVDQLLRRRRVIGFAGHAAAEAVLYLRSFADDTFALFAPFAGLGPRFRLLPGRTRFEEFLVSLLYGTAEVVAIGRPGERLPSLGAARTYWTDETWQGAVQATAARAKALIVIAGRTVGLSWEVGQLRELDLLGKTLFVFPPDDYEGTRARYLFIVEELGTAPEHTLPLSLLSSLTAVAFDGEGRPVHYMTCGRDWSAYMATEVHFLSVLRGQGSFQAPWSMAALAEVTSDPFNQAAFLLDRGDRRRAEDLVADLLEAPAGSDVKIGAAWWEIEVHQDNDAARRWLDEALSGSPEDPAVIHAIEVFGDIAAGTRVPRDLLRARWPEHVRDRTDLVRLGRKRMRTLTLVRFVNSVAAAEGAREDHEFAEAIAHYDVALQAVSDERLSTARAHILVCKADILLEVGELDDALALYQEVSRTTSAPVIPLGAMRSLDPVMIVDDALRGMYEVSVVREEHALSERRLVEWRGFRIKEGLGVDAARTALALAEHYLQLQDFAAGAEWARVARAEMLSYGQSREAAEALLSLARAANASGDPATALRSSIETISTATIASHLGLASSAHYEAGVATEKLGDLGAAWSHFESSLSGALKSNDPYGAGLALRRMRGLDPVRAVPVARTFMEKSESVFVREACDAMFAAAVVLGESSRSPEADSILEEAHDALFVLLASSPAAEMEVNIVNLIASTIPNIDDLQTLNRSTRRLAGLVEYMSMDVIDSVALSDLGEKLNRTGRAEACLYVISPVVQRIRSSLKSVDVSMMTSRDILARRVDLLERYSRLLAHAYTLTDEHHDAVAIWLDLLPPVRSILDSHPGDYLWSRMHAKVHSAIGYHLEKLGRDVEAAAEYDAAISIQASLVEAGVESVADLAEYLSLRGYVADRMGESEAAIIAFCRADAVLRDNRVDGPWGLKFRLRVLYNIAQLHADDDPAPALAAIDEGISLRLPEGDEEALSLRARLLVCRVDVLRNLGLSGEVRSAISRAIAAYRELAELDPKAYGEIWGSVKKRLDKLG